MDMGSKGAPGNLFTTVGLTPSLSDLDQIFDNSDDTSSDEALAVATPPNSNNPGKCNECFVRV